MLDLVGIKAKLRTNIQWNNLSISCKTTYSSGMTAYERKKNGDKVKIGNKDEKLGYSATLSTSTLLTDAWNRIRVQVTNFLFVIIR